MGNRTFKLSPSDFKFLWEECKHCYYQKVVNNSPRPFAPFPAIFTQINSLIQNPLVGKNLNTLHSDLPSGTIIKSEGWLESIVYNSCFIKGKYDLLVQLDDGTYCVVDLKISNPKDEDIYKYGSQLHAYKFSLENPVKGDPINVSRMGLLVIHPQSVAYQDGKVVLHNTPTWIEIKDDMPAFLKFIDEISTILNGECPLPSLECKFCQYKNLTLKPANNRLRKLRFLRNFLLPNLGK